MFSLSREVSKASSIAAAIVFAFLTMHGHAFSQSRNIAEKARQSIVYIYFDVTDPNTGAKSPIQGTGFIVSPQGYVLTASHLFRDWRKQNAVDKAANIIKGTLQDKPGFVAEPALILSVVNAGDPDSEDVALLKLPELAGKDYQPAPVCFSGSADVHAGDELIAFGFPMDQNFQPVAGVLGTQNALGGRWAAAITFTYGMSGGPVYSSRGFVIGLVKGGAADSDAVRWITPLNFAINYLKIAGLHETCDTPFPPPNREWPFQIQRAVCGNEAAVKSLVVSIQETKKEYDKRLIDSDNFASSQNKFLDEIMRRLMAAGTKTKACISQELVFIRGLFAKAIINPSQWESSRKILWKTLDELLVTNVQSVEDVQQALVEIKNLSDQSAIDDSQLNATRKALNEKRSGSISGNSLPR